MSASFSPSQWICRTDPRTQRTYYVNRCTGRSAWQPALHTVEDTMPAAALYKAVIPAVGLTSASVTATSPIVAESAPAPPQLVTVSSSDLLARSNMKSAAEKISRSGSSNAKDALTAVSGAALERENDGNVKATLAINNCRQESYEAHSFTGGNCSKICGSTSTGVERHQCTQPQPMLPSEQESLKFVFSPAAITTASSPLSLKVPLSPSASPSDVVDMKNASPLRKSPVQYGLSSRNGVPGGADLLTTSAASVALFPATNTIVRSPVELTVSIISHSNSSPSELSSSPMQRRTTTKTESSASLSSNQTSRPSHRLSSPIRESGNQQSPLPLPSLVSTLIATGARVNEKDGRDGPQTQSTITTATASSVTVAPSSSASPALLASSHQQQQKQSQSPKLLDGTFVQEETAAEEWRLTQRTWELEGERARLESELAVLRGPVKVEAQSIMEDHDRLLEAQRALETAATLAANQQMAKREELEGLRQRLSELQAQHHNATFLLSTLEECLAFVTGRCQEVQDEEERLKRERRELEDVLLPSEEAALREAQHRLYEQRQRVASQQQQLEERQRLLNRSYTDVQRLKQRLNQLLATSTDDDDNPLSNEKNFLSAVARREDRSPEDSAFAKEGDGKGGTFALVTAANCLTASSEHRKQLLARGTELGRKVSLLRVASRELHENKILLGQLKVLRESTQRLRREMEVWQPAVDEAHAMLKELKHFSQMQTCKYGLVTTPI